MTTLNLVGSSFGKLTVIGPPTRKHGRTAWLCKCDCGRCAVVEQSNLRGGKSASCGVCVRTKHGKSNTPMYQAFARAKHRCNNPKSKDYREYGGRGIRFLFTSFEHFEHEIGAFWQKGLSLDRIDNNGNYEPGNVKWSSAQEQVNNRRVNVFVEFEGHKVTLTELARLTGASRSTIGGRYKKYGSDVEKLLNPNSYKSAQKVIKKEELK